MCKLKKLGKTLAQAEKIQENICANKRNLGDHKHILKKFGRTNAQI